MPHSLALCLDAPLQSWGTRSRANVRDTAMEPTKSGVVGLLGAALGMPRDDTDTLARLADLRLAVRVDREGILERDYHTAQDVPTTTGSGHRTVVSTRYYLADALFLVVVEGDPHLLDSLHAAIQNPRWPLFLGRRAFVPARPLVAPSETVGAPTGAGRLPQSAEVVVASHPWLETRPQAQTAELHKTVRTPLRTVIDCEATCPGAETRYDHPLAFHPNERRFATRTVRIGQVPLTDDLITAGNH